MTVFSKHAKQRWQERFPRLNMEEEFYRTNETLIRKGSIVRKTKDGIFFILAETTNPLLNAEFIVVTVYDPQEMRLINKERKRKKRSMQRKSFKKRRAMQN